MVSIWSSVETSLAVLGACVPVLEGFAVNNLTDKPVAMARYVRKVCSRSTLDSASRGQPGRDSSEALAMCRSGRTPSFFDLPVFEGHLGRRHGFDNDVEYGWICSLDRGRAEDQQVAELSATMSKEQLQSRDPRPESSTLGHRRAVESASTRRTEATSTEASRHTSTRGSRVGQTMGMEALDELSRLTTDNEALRLALEEENSSCESYKTAPLKERQRISCLTGDHTSYLAPIPAYLPPGWVGRGKAS